MEEKEKHEESIVTTFSTEEIHSFLEDPHILQIFCDDRTSKPKEALPRLLKDTMNLVFRVLHPDRAYLFLYNESGELVPKVIQRKEQEGKEGGVAVSQTILKRVVEEKKAILSLDARVDPRFSGSESIQIHGIRSVICVPLKVEDRILGALHADMRCSDGEFSKNDLILLSAIGNLLALAIDNLRQKSSR